MDFFKLNNFTPEGLSDGIAVVPNSTQALQVTLENLQVEALPLSKEYQSDAENYSPHVTFSRRSDGSAVYEMSIVGCIGCVSKYIDVLNALTIATSKDEVYIDICSPGGDLKTGIAISTAVLNCAAIVHTTAVGLCASAGSLIWCCGDVLHAKPYASIMFHMSSHMDWGQSKSIGEKALFLYEAVKEMMTPIALEKGIVTPEEFKTFTEDYQDVWISGIEMEKRLLERRRSN